MTDARPERLTIDHLATPVGEALIVTDEAGFLRGFDWSGDEGRLMRLMRRSYPGTPISAGPAPEPTRRALAAYFAGDVRAIEGLAWRAAGTPFQLSVWRALCAIPAGETISYAELARRVGRPKAVRAVGQANGANPVALVAPCHRVIASGLGLGGYGGGLDRKRWLLRHEGANWREAAEGA